MANKSFQVGGRVSRVDLAVNAAVWLLYASMFTVFGIASAILAFVVPGLDVANCLAFVAVLLVVGGAAYCTSPPAVGTIRNHAAIASVYVCVAIGMVAFRPDSMIPLGPAMFLGPFAASRLTSRWQIVGHYAAGSVVLGLPALLGLIGSAAAFGVATIVPATWVLGFCVVIVLEAAEAQGGELARLVRRDPLTGIGNRRLLDEQLAIEIDRHRESGQHLSVIALDLNGFKALNDVLGHGAGDDVLREVAAALVSTARKDDTVVRQGGDEFCLLLPQTTGPQATFVATAIRTRLAGLADGQLPITSGFGIATYPSDAATADHLLAAADARLATDKSRTDPELDTRRDGVSGYSELPRPHPVADPPPSGHGTLITRVSRRELARNPYTWFATGLQFAVFTALATGCVFLVPGAASWSPAIPIAAALISLSVFVRRPPAIGSISNHALITATYLSAAAFMAAFPAAAGGAMCSGIFIGPLAAVRLVDRRQIAAHQAAATIAFSTIVVFGYADRAVSLSLLATVLAIWGLCASCVAILEAAERQGDELEQLVRRDPLTGVGNRRMLTEQLDRDLAACARRRRPLTVLALDLNGFKALNDQFGHAAGDQLLCDVANAIQNVVGDDDTVVRQGGDEFCVLLPGTSRTDAQPTADAIRAALTTIEVHGLQITTGIGIASYPTEATTAEVLLEVADELLRAAKDTSPGRVAR